MEVKIYREPENEHLILNEENLAAYNELATKLGIQTQTLENKVPNVYTCLNVAMQKQLQALCPKLEKAEDYKRTTIPLEVLKVLDFSKENNMFDGYQIWYNDVDPDPLLIGWNWMDENAKKNDYTWQKHRFLLARWGDCALEMPELLQLGFDNLKQQLSDKAQLALNKSKEVLENTDLYVRNILNDRTNGLQIDLNTTASNTIY